MRDSHWHRSSNRLRLRASCRCVQPHQVASPVPRNSLAGFRKCHETTPAEMAVAAGEDWRKDSPLVAAAHVVLASPDAPA